MNPSRPPRKEPLHRRRSGLDTAAGRWIYGRHAVAAALANPERRWHRLLALAAQAEEGRTLAAGALAARYGSGEPVRVVEREALAALLPQGAVHQGLTLEVEPLEPADLDDVLRAASGPAILLALDQVGDPHNVGAVLRSAAAFGAAAVIVTRHGTPLAGGTLAKAASGALERVPLVPVVNLARALERMKEAGFWVCGLAEDAAETLAALDLGVRVVLVLGAEENGLRRLVRERCDHLARLPTHPWQPTLNVSNAAAVALYELIRRRG
ncbi:MAG: 23S rRNA (guanosine(2251)-2'-O)-methyltransferase RlmB [Stellaceae bacterium]